MATSALIAVVVALFSIAAAQLGLHILEAVSETLLPREGIQLDVFRPDFRTTYRKMALGTLSVSQPGRVTGPTPSLPARLLTSFPVFVGQQRHGLAFVGDLESYPVLDYRHDRARPG
jgi:hypothetical protein